LDVFDKELMNYRRSQVIEVNVRRSAFENVNRSIGWTDDGFFIELINGQESIGHRARVAIHDLRRSFGVADLIQPGHASPSRTIA
jgi:hypothetical protein